MCDWHYAESAVVSNVDWKLLWWAFQVNMDAEQLLPILILTHREDRPDSELMKHLNERPASHREHMLRILEMRLEIIRQNCLSPEELLQAAAGSPGVWKKWYDHAKHCYGGCVNQYEYLERMFRSLEPYRLLTSES